MDDPARLLVGGGVILVCVAIIAGAIYVLPGAIRTARSDDPEADAARRELVGLALSFLVPAAIAVAVVAFVTFSSIP